MLPFLYIYNIYKENGNGKLRLISANRKQKFVFLGRQTINGNGRLLCQQNCPSLCIGQKYTVQISYWVLFQLNAKFTSFQSC